MPDGWDWVRKNKNFFLLQMEEGSRYEHVATGSCIRKCFPTNATGVVTVAESECQTNCMAKALETRALFEHMNLKSEGKNSIIL